MNQEKKAFSRATLDALSAHLCVLDESGNILSVNRAWREFAETNGENPDAVSENVNYLAVCASAFGEEKKIAAAFASGIRAVLSGALHEFFLEYPCPSPLEKRWFIGRITRFSAEGAIRAVVAHENITQRKLAEDALQEERERLALIIEGTNVGTWEWNVQTGATVYNERWAQMTGYTLEEISPVSIETCLRFAHPEDMESVRECLDRHFSGASPYYECEFRMRHKDGHWVWVLDRGKVSTWSEEGKPLLMQGMHQDITVRKQALAQIHQLEKAESLGRMAGAIAHHYNNLLSVIMGNLELAMGDLPKDFRPATYLDQAMQASRRASVLSAMMLTYLGQTVVRRKRLDLSNACRQALADLQSAMPGNVTLETDMPDPGPTVTADEDQIRELLDILLINAREALDQGPGVVSLNIRTASSSDIPVVHRWPVDFVPGAAGYTCLEITDTGCGIAEEDIEKLFDPFYSTKFTGRGLGLSVALGMVKTHEGCIAVESMPGRGSVFNVFLPV